MIRHLLGCAAVALLMVTCDKPADEVDCSVMNHDGVELISPRGTESFAYGSTVPIKWKVDPDKVSLIDVKVSTVSPDGPFRSICKSISVNYDLGVQCMDTIWTIGSEYEPVTYGNKSQTVYLQVSKYSAANEFSDVSGTITINKP